MNYLNKIFIGSLLVIFVSQSTLAQKEVVVEPQTEKSDKKSISDEELEKFADIYKEVQQKNKQAQRKMAKTVKEEGITIQRYQKISKASKNPNSEVEVTPEEKKKMIAIGEAFQGIQKEFKSKIINVIEDGGMTTERYQQVYRDIRKDKGLQERFGELMQG